VYRYLEARGIETHYVDTIDDHTMLVQCVAMIPIEWATSPLNVSEQRVLST